MRADILDFLRADGALMALLPGGLYDEPIGQETTPEAFDANGELRTCGYVGVSSDVAFGPATALRAGRMVVAISLYQRVGHTSIDAAAARIRALLHNRRVPPASGGAWDITWANDIPDTPEPTLDSRMTVTRYTVPYTSPAP